MHKSQRLIHLMMSINAKKTGTVRELADEFGLSTRTITRDLQDLSELGFPIYSVQGRGGGYRLLNERILPPIAFLESEAMAIFFACQSLQYLGSLPFEQGATSALLKFFHYLPADVRVQIDRIKEKVVIWSPYRAMSSAHLTVLLQAIMHRSVVNIGYRSNDETVTRDIQPIGLYASHGFWFCPAYCFLRQGYRLFRVDRVISANLNPTIPCRDDVDQRSVFNWNLPERNDSERTELVVSLSAQGVRKLEENGWFADHINRREDGSGTVQMMVPVMELLFHADMIWGLGHEATIIEPKEAVDYMKQKIEALRQKYV